MSHFSKIYKTTLIASVIYLSVHTTHLVYAAPDQYISDCTDPLGIANTRYILTATTTQSCIITADGVIIDGQSIYGINGNVSSTDYDINIENANVTSFISSYSSAHSDHSGNINITNSTISDYVNTIHDSDVAGVSGSIYITSSIIGSGLSTLGRNYDSGNISIVSSTITGFVGANSEFGISGNISADSSMINGNLRSYSHSGTAGSVSVASSTVTGYVKSYGTSGTAGNVSIASSETGSVVSISYNGTSGDISIAGSTSDYVRSNSYNGSLSGDISIASSTTGTLLSHSSSGTAGSISIASSTTGYVMSNSNDGTAGNISITNSSLSDYVKSMGSTGSGSVYIASSTVINYAWSYSNSGITGNVSVDSSTINGSVVSNSSSGTAGDVAVSNSAINGYVSSYSASGMTAGDISIASSTINSHVKSNSNSGTSGSITITNDLLDIHGKTISTKAGDGSDNAKNGTISLNFNSLITDTSTIVEYTKDLSVNNSHLGPFNGVFNPSLSTSPETLVSGNITSTGVTLTWTPPTSDGGFTLLGYYLQQYDTVSNATTTTTLASTTLTTDVTGLTPGRTYTFSISATNAAGRSVPTTLSVTTTVPVVVPPPSGGGGGSSSGRSRVQLPAITSPTIATSTKPLFTRQLFPNMKGLDVTALQSFLTQKGFYNGPITEYFGPLTKQALIKYQISRGIDAVGNVGPITLKTLNSEMNVPKSPLIPIVTTNYEFTRDISLGSENQDVLNLQKLLISLGHLKTNPTGYFGNLTLQAVKAYQTKHNINPTGYVGPLTRKALGGEK